MYIADYLTKLFTRQNMIRREKDINANLLFLDAFLSNQPIVVVVKCKHPDFL